MGLIKPTLLRARPQELGKIKIGGVGKELDSKRGGKYRQPVKYEHFVVTTRVRGADGNFLRDEAIHAIVGDKPTTLEGRLMFEDVEEIFHSSMDHYEGKTRKTSTCDGEFRTILDTGATEPCYRANGGECPCKPYGRLAIQLLHAPLFGFHVYRTTSWESTNNIQSALKDIFNTFGTLYHVPVRLVVYPSEDHHNGSVSTSQKVGLVLAMSMQEVAGHIASARQYSSLAMGVEVKQLAAGVNAELAARDVEEAAIIREEFFPEHTDHEMRADSVRAALNAPDAEEAEPTVEEDEKPVEFKKADPPVQQEPPKQMDERTKQLNGRYFAMLTELGMSDDIDRKTFQARLHKEGKLTSPSCAAFTRQDYLSAIAELTQIKEDRETA